MKFKECTSCAGSGRDLDGEVCKQCNGTSKEGGIVEDGFYLETAQHCSCCGVCFESGMKPHKQLTLPGFEE